MDVVMKIDETSNMNKEQGKNQHFHIRVLVKGIEKKSGVFLGKINVEIK